MNNNDLMSLQNQIELMKNYQTQQLMNPLLGPASLNNPMYINTLQENVADSQFFALNPLLANQIFSQVNLVNMQNVPPQQTEIVERKVILISLHIN